MTDSWVCCVTPHNRLEPETIRAIFTQTYAGRIDHHFTCNNDPALAGHNIVAAYQRLQALFLAEPGYSHLWIVENDVIPPPDALEKLLAVDADIVYGVYCFRRGTPVVNITDQVTTCSMTYRAGYWKKNFERGAVIECAGLGWGCTLLRRHVLERFPMRSEFGGGDSDTQMARDAKRAGLVLRAHLGVVCGHKRPDGVTLWPAADKPFYRKVGTAKARLANVRILVPVAIWDERGVPKVLRKGDQVAIDFELAASFVAVGQAEYPPVETAA